LKMKMDRINRTDMITKTYRLRAYPVNHVNPFNGKLKRNNEYS
jgi:hypothetical protein